MKLAKRPSRPVTAKQSKHNNAPPRPPINARSLLFCAGGGGGLNWKTRGNFFFIQKSESSFRFTSVDNVDLVELLYDIRYVERALELLALQEFTLEEEKTIKWNEFLNKQDVSDADGDDDQHNNKLQRREEDQC